MQKERTENVGCSLNVTLYFKGKIYKNVAGKNSVDSYQSLSVISYERQEACGDVCIRGDPALCLYALIFLLFCGVCVFSGQQPSGSGL